MIRADGGPLTTEIVLARNFTREVELFLPVQLILMPEYYHGGHTGVVAVASTLWVLVLLFFPLFNRHRLRIGDLLAGTRVVVSPPVESPVQYWPVRAPHHRLPPGKRPKCPRSTCLDY